MDTTSPCNVPLAVPLSALDRCPHCSVARPNLEFQIPITKGRVPNSTAVEVWVIYQCTSCMNIVAFLAELPDSAVSDVRGYIALYNFPTSRMMPAVHDSDMDDWPHRAATYFRQSLNSLSAPDAAVMVAGSAVDAMLKAKGYESGSVYDRIGKAVTDGLLTAEMGEWAHSVRLAANNPRHADLNSPHASPDEAKASVEFVRALGQFLFVLPAKVARGRERAEQAAVNAADENSGNASPAS